MTRLEACAINYIGETPVVMLDIDRVEANYHSMKQGMSTANIHYAVKANPNTSILSRLHDIGCKFDAASVGEINLLFDIGVKPENISFGNTIKKTKDIKYAYDKGITLFAVDSEEEIEKVASVAPNSNIYVRILIATTEAEWPLSRKFGCVPNHTISILNYAKEYGLNAIGISFHIGSQTRHPSMWKDTLDGISKIWTEARSLGHNLYLLNIGGGFPSYYGTAITELEIYCSELQSMIYDRFEGIDYLMSEPGRGLVGDAGIIVSEVVLVAKKQPSDEVRWVYLDIGKFSGLSETMEEAIKYQFIIPERETSNTSKCILAGPTCDSADVMYENNKVDLPIDLKAGDRFIVKNTSAYTTTYSTVWFNGFEPLTEMVI
jgi:ornithine decarboxylase